MGKKAVITKTHNNIVYLGISTRNESNDDGNTYTRIYFDRVYPTNYFINSFGDYVYCEKDSFVYQSITREELKIEYCRFVIDSVKDRLLMSYIELWKFRPYMMGGGVILVNML